MNFIIKKFNDLTLEELYSILKARNKVFIEEQNCPYMDLDSLDQNSYHLFLKEKNEVIAYLRILKKGLSFKEISIGRVLVLKEYRKKGLAYKMVLKAISFIEKNLNEKEIRISAQEYIKSFYKGLGFKEVSEVYLEDNIPHIEMLYKS
ncbi:GNAT family N-acetyltransferase [Clostridium oceanicum]|uniref:GNAT family N-acetyltransferase n=1 Tax=Clostridium oceanicum TaxID=1543 RepID=A0ABP3UMX8_9CLOT